MQTVTDLIDAARKALNVSSDAEFARQLGVSRGTIANWKSGYSLPDTVMCATLAGLTGLPLARVLGIVGEARAVSREEKAVWRKLAATAMALCLAVGFALPHKAHAAVSGIDKSAVYTLCEIEHPPDLGLCWLRVAMAGPIDEAGDCHNGNAPDPTAVRPYFPTRTPAISRSPPKMPLIPGSAPKTPSISGSTSSSPLSSQLRT
ncbi:DUF3693 domain-containing protein [Stenotrophomonas maltophilia]|uniref:DUF3693 domain-containing protein n=1 Tax=Stenotrophomonas maltophilia TaxID=40324 RepID=UPI0030160399